jgi:hypothetical protein
MRHGYPGMKYTYIIIGLTFGTILKIQGISSMVSNLHPFNFNFRNKKIPTRAKLGEYRGWMSKQGFHNVC